eukprot:7389917-Prymnesium_polylepis.1
MHDSQKYLVGHCALASRCSIKSESKHSSSVAPGKILLRLVSKGARTIANVLSKPCKMITTKGGLHRHRTALRLATPIAADGYRKCEAPDTETPRPQLPSSDFHGVHLLRAGIVATTTSTSACGSTSSPFAAAVYSSSAKLDVNASKMLASIPSHLPSTKHLALAQLPNAHHLHHHQHCRFRRRCFRRRHCTATVPPLPPLHAS